MLERERRAAYRFLDRILVPDRDSAFIVKFDAKVGFLCGPTSSLAELRLALGQADFSLKKNARQSPTKEPKRKDIAGGTKLQTAVKRQFRQRHADPAGPCFTVTPDRTLEQILADIEAEWTAQYSIGFTPAVDASGEYRKLSLRTTGNRFVVHTRDSYFAR